MGNQSKARTTRDGLLVSRLNSPAMVFKSAIIISCWMAGIALAYLLGLVMRPDPAASGRTTGNDARVSAEMGFSMSPGRALRLPDSRSASRAFARVVMGLKTSGEFQASFEELLPDHEDARFHDALFILADAWGTVAPEEAVAWLDALEFNDARNPYLFSALTRWAAGDPGAVVAWIEARHPDSGPTRDYLLAGLVRGASTHDPERALKLLMQSPPSPERTGSIDFLLQAWNRVGTAHARERVAALPANEDGLKERAIRQLVATHPADELVSARTWASGLSDATDRLAARTAIAANWSRHDPIAAVEWAEGLEDTATRSRALGEIATRWARTDPLAAGRWIERNADRVDHDMAARAVAWSTVAIDPDTAFAQVAGITHAPLRDETFEQLGRLWLSEQPQRAKRFFEGESPIPPPIRERLLDSFE